MARVQAAPKGKGNVDAVAAKAAKAAGVNAGKGDGSTEVVIPKVSSKALQPDLGLKVIMQLAKASDDDEQAQALAQAARKRNGDAQAMLTLGIQRAANADKSILTALPSAFSDDKKAIGDLWNQIGVAIGIKEVITVGSGDKAKQTVTWTKACYQYFPAPGEDKATPEYMRKQSNRTNFLHRLKQCAQVACGIIDSGTKAEMDKTTGTLMLTGPAIKSQFGAASVKLDEKQKVVDTKGNEVELKQRPSFNAIATKAGESHGKIITPRSNTRGGQSMSPEKAVEQIGRSFVQAVEKLPVDKITDTIKAVFASVLSAIDQKAKAAGAK